MPNEGALETKSIDEIIDYIHKTSQENRNQTLEWSCVTEAKDYKSAYVAQRKEWADAAYEADWDMIFKVSRMSLYIRGIILEASHLPNSFIFTYPVS